MVPVAVDVGDAEGTRPRPLKMAPPIPPVASTTTVSVTTEVEEPLVVVKVISSVTLDADNPLMVATGVAPTAVAITASVTTKVEDPLVVTNVLSSVTHGPVGPVMVACGPF